MSSEEFKFDQETQQALLNERLSHPVSPLTEVVYNARYKNLKELMHMIPVISAHSGERGNAECCLIYNKSKIGTILFNWFIESMASTGFKIEPKAEHKLFIIFSCGGCGDYTQVPTYCFQEEVKESYLVRSSSIVHKEKCLD